MYTDILILSRLASGPAHGYEIKKHVERIVGVKTINNNVLYPALRRFQSDGVIERVSSDAVTGRPPRTVYRLTDVGRDLLLALLHDADPDTLASDAEFQLRVAFFDRLDPPDRLAIIAVRRAHVVSQIALHESLRGEAVDHSWAPKVIDFNVAQLRAELDWLDHLAAQASGTGDG